MFERFTDRARRAVVLAQEEARSLRHNYIGTEHLLLGLLSEGEGVAAKALQELGVDLGELRSRILEKVGRGPTEPESHVPFTPRAKHVMEMSLQEALKLGHNYIGTEHLLLGVLREEEGLGAQILTASGVTLPDARTKVIQLLSGYGKPRISFGSDPDPAPSTGARHDDGLSPALRDSLVRAREIARPGDLVGTHHLLAAFAVMADTAASEILASGGFDAEGLPTPIVSWDVTGTGDEDPLVRATRGTVVDRDDTGVTVRLDDEGLSRRLGDALAAGEITEEALRRALGRTWAELLGDLDPGSDDTATG